METASDLFGLIDVATIIGGVDELCAYGVSRDREIYVAHASGYIDQKCLIRFDHNKDDSVLSTNFITNRVPSNFTAKRQEEYVLVAIWNERMGQRPPSLEDVEKYYDPGRLGFAIYIEDNYTKRKGLVSINADGFVRRPGTSINQAVGELPNPQLSPRLILTESADHLGKIIEAIEHKRLMPIAMKAKR